jgi:NADPH-dependent 2,4-dienoyl-CoA reductase/sulfur reductase-like enzyme
VPSQVTCSTEAVVAKNRLKGFFRGVIEKRVSVVGGGWSGCAAAVSARKQGAEVTLLERIDMFLGTGLVGVIIRNNGPYTVHQEISIH